VQPTPPGYVKDIRTFLSEKTARLEQERGFTYARLSADQDNASGKPSSSEHPI
jgi:hypothetical protein